MRNMNALVLSIRQRVRRPTPPDLMHQLNRAARVAVKSACGGGIAEADPAVRHGIIGDEVRAVRTPPLDVVTPGSSVSPGIGVPARWL
jgi:hypothetical protein